MVDAITCDVPIAEPIFAGRVCSCGPDAKPFDVSMEPDLAMRHLTDLAKKEQQHLKPLDPSWP